MLMRSPKKNNSIDYEKVNEGITLLNKMLRVLFIVLIIGAIMIITYVFKEPLLKEFLKFYHHFS